MTTKNIPPRVKDQYEYWHSDNPPPERSARCQYWLEQIAAGWRPNARISCLGYDDSAEFYGVYIWEYLNVLSPFLDKLCDEERKLAELEEGR